MNNIKLSVNCHEWRSRQFVGKLAGRARFCPERCVRVSRRLFNSDHSVELPASQGFQVRARRLACEMGELHANLSPGALGPAAFSLRNCSNYRAEADMTFLKEGPLCVNGYAFEFRRENYIFSVYSACVKILKAFKSICCSKSNCGCGL